jgi:hypothetical protein
MSNVDHSILHFTCLPLYLKFERKKGCGESSFTASAA